MKFQSTSECHLHLNNMYAFVYIMMLAMSKIMRINPKIRFFDSKDKKPMNIIHPFVVMFTKACTSDTA